MTDVSIFSQIRGSVRQYFSTAQQDVQQVLADGGEQLVTQALPERSELVKLGKSYGCALPTASTFTYVAAWPTTRSELALYNGESTGGPSYVIDRCWMSEIATGATGPRALLGQIVPVGATGPINVVPSDTATVLRWQLSGKAGTSNACRLVVANTTWAIANKWFPLGSSIIQPALVGLATASIGLSIEAKLEGRIIIPPGAALCLAGIAAAANGTAVAGIDWHEVQLNLG